MTVKVSDNLSVSFGQLWSLPYCAWTNGRGPREYGPALAEVRAEIAFLEARLDQLRQAEAALREAVRREALRFDAANLRASRGPA